MDQRKGCFGYYMSGTGCSKCKDLVRCYERWKKDGEPSKPSERVCPNRIDKRCTTCD